MLLTTAKKEREEAREEQIRNQEQRGYGNTLQQQLDDEIKYTDDVLNLTHRTYVSRAEEESKRV
jgi:hypothetical protein